MKNVCGSIALRVGCEPYLIRVATLPLLAPIAYFFFRQSKHDAIISDYEKNTILRRGERYTVAPPPMEVRIYRCLSVSKILADMARSAPFDWSFDPEDP